MAVAYTEIARVLHRARRRQAWIVVASAAAFGCAGAAICLLLATAMLGAGWGSAGLLRAVGLSLAAVAVAVALGWAVIVLARRASGAAAVARSVGERVPELRSDLLSSVELEDEYERARTDGHYSAALIDAHAARTAERARSLDLERAVPATPVRRGLGALGAVLAIGAVVIAVAPRTFAAGWRRLTGDAGPVAIRRAEPITGDIQLTYVYPAYMHRETKTLSGTGGEIAAPKGTSVRLETRADRAVTAAEIVIERADPTPQPSPLARGEGAPPAASPPSAPALVAVQPRTYQLTVKNTRELSGSFVVEESGAYRFRFKNGNKVIAEGPPLPIAVEPDAYPEVRITAPAQEVEVDGRARVHIEWTASDDIGLEDLALVTRLPHGEERRTQLRGWNGASRREVGSHELELAPLRLAEGERLEYWLEVHDNDTVSGPKRSASATHVVKIYSEAEHHQAALAKAQRLWEEMVGLLGDRLGFFDGARTSSNSMRSDFWDPQKVAQAATLDGRTRTLHEGFRTAARELRHDRAAPKQLAPALDNVAAGIRPLEEALTAVRGMLSRIPSFRQSGTAAIVGRTSELDLQLDRELEKDVLYLEELFDQQRADDLVRVAKDLSARRRDLANLLESYRQAPSEAKKKELLAEVARLRARMQDMMRRMAELAKGINDEHMNREALAEMARSQDAMTGMDEVEKRLAQGDVEGAMKALDQLGNSMQQMLASLERTAGRPGEKNEALMKEMLAFKKQLEDVQQRQQQVASETEQVKAEYRKRLGQRMKQLEGAAKKLEQLAADAREELQQAEKGVSIRSEDDYGQSRDRLRDAERALQGRDFDAALQSVRRAIGPMQRLAVGLQDDSFLAEHYPQLKTKEPRDLRDAQRHANAAIPPARRLKDELERMFPDPKSVLSERDQQKLGELAQKQGQLEKDAGDLQQKLGELAQKAPVFPPQAGEMIGGSQRHMQRAQGELAQRNPQRGHGEQRQALDDLDRFRRGLEEMAKNQKGGGGGAGFPFPFAQQDPGGGREGDGYESSREKVEIPGADQYKVPDEFRKDLLEAMKQGAPEPYKGDVKHYYEELVK